MAISRRIGFASGKCYQATQDAVRYTVTCEVHVNTMEGFWSLLRSWLRPHRGVSQEKLPLYLGFFEFVHNVRSRGKALLGSLVGLLLKPSPRNTG
jgi:transposase-like protein